MTETDLMRLKMKPCDFNVTVTKQVKTLTSSRVKICLLQLRLKRTEKENVKEHSVHIHVRSVSANKGTYELPLNGVKLLLRRNCRAHCHSVRN